MNTLKTALFATFLTISGSGALNAQAIRHLDPQSANQAWQTVEMSMPRVQVPHLTNSSGSQKETARAFMPYRIPQIKGGGIVYVPPINGVGGKLSLGISLPGIYLIQGVNCDGSSVRGKDYFIDFPFDRMIEINLLDVNLFPTAAAAFNTPCTIQVFKVDDGVSMVSTPVFPSFGGPEEKVLRVLSEYASAEGDYKLAVEGNFSSSATVILGGNILASRISPNPFGYTMLVFPSGSYSPLGLTTLTVCDDGECKTTVFERRHLYFPTPNTTTTAEKG